MIVEEDLKEDEGNLYVREKERERKRMRREEQQNKNFYDYLLPNRDNVPS
jgi:hypothetical protein